MLNFLRDCSFVGPAFPEPFVQFELESELAKAGLLPKTTGAEGRELQALWNLYRRKLRELISGGPRRVRNQAIEPIRQRLGYAQISDGHEIRTREGPEDGGALLIAPDGSKLRLWCTEYDEDLDAPTRRGAAYRFSHLQVARRVLKAQQERVGLLTNGAELRIIILDLARTDSEIIIRIDPAWKDRRATDPIDSFLLLLALASPAGVQAIPELVDKARLQQARVTKELRRQAREAVEGFLQEVLNHPGNQEKLGDLNARHALAHELWREALIVVYRLLFVLKLEATDDPARSFKFSTSTIWRNTFSPTTALPRFVRKLLDEGVPSGNLIEQSVRKLFQMFVDGLECSELHVRPLGGSLFGQEATPLLSDLKWSERGVALLLDRLLWTSPKQNSQGRERVHYGSLDVEDLGRVYEALLELAPGVATEDMCRLRRSKLEVVVPVAQGERYRPTVASHNGVQDGNDEEVEGEAEAETEEEESEEPARSRGTQVEWIERIPVGQFYLRVGLGRKASGSYYTPQSFVKFLVQQTLEPIVAERCPKENPKPAEILKIKVLDPAMGSGHFLVETCRFLGGKLYEATRLCDERLAQAMRTLEAAQNDEIRAKAVRDAADYGQRLAAFLPPEAKLLGYLPSRAPEAGESSGISQKQAEAICRRLVAIHCLYGVDKNPLGVELAKVALWLESHSEGFPLTFLDHRLVLGDSITVPFFDHLLTYPGNKQSMNDLLSQGLREKFSGALIDAIALVKDIESTLCSTMPDFEAKASLREQMETRLAPFKVVAAAWSGGVMLNQACDDDAYAELVRTVADTGSLPVLLENERLRKMIGEGLGVGSVCADSLSVLKSIKTGRYTPALPFDLAFPEVFFRGGDLTARVGFDVVIGNPPWDRMLPADKEFFARYNFEILNCASRRERGSLQRQLLENESVRQQYNDYVEVFRGLERIIDSFYPNQIAIVDNQKTIGKQDSFRVFMERDYQLLCPLGNTGVVVPAAFHVGEGATGIRRLYLERLRLNCCFSFQNKRKIFDIVANVKFDLVVASKGAPTNSFDCAFYLHDESWLFSDNRSRPALNYTLDFVRSTGGPYLTFIELQAPEEVAIAQQCFSRGITLGTFCDQRGIRIGREMNMSDDSWRFTPTVKVLPDGDPRDGDILRKLNEAGYFVVSEEDSIHLYTDHWTARPIYLVHISSLQGRESWLCSTQYYRLYFRRIATIVDARSFMPAIVPPGWLSASPQAHRTTGNVPTSTDLLLLGILCSYSADWNLRLRITSTVNMFIAESVPLPESNLTQASLVVHLAVRLTCNHVGYRELWYREIGDVWREASDPFTWPVLRDEDQRWQARTSIDAVVADAYGLSREQYERILASFHHKSYSSAPEKCLAKFDELKQIGIEAFARKYDPYWDIRLNEDLPEPVINVPMPEATQTDGQHTLTFTDGPNRSARRPAVHAAANNELFQKLRELIADRHQINSADVQATLGCTTAQARAMLKRLVEENFAVVEGRGRSTHYVAVSSAEAGNAHPTGRVN